MLVIMLILDVFFVYVQFFTHCHWLLSKTSLNNVPRALVYLTQFASVQLTYTRLQSSNIFSLTTLFFPNINRNFQCVIHTSHTCNNFWRQWPFMSTSITYNNTTFSFWNWFYNVPTRLSTRDLTTLIFSRPLTFFTIAFAIFARKILIVFGIVENSFLYH